MKKNEWTNDTLDYQSAFMKNIASNTTIKTAIKHKNTTIEEVLDKIRAEIREIVTIERIDEYTAYIKTGEQVKQMILEIVDKYIAETEMTDEQSMESKNISKDRCMYCEEMFDLFCAKAKKSVTYEEFNSAPYKPKWCPGRTPSKEYHN